MTILERLLRHDAWTTRELLLRAQPLADAALDQEFDIGLRTLRRTFSHIVGNMECWYDLMAGIPQRDQQQGTPNTVAALIERLDLVGGQLLALGNAVDREQREDEEFADYLDQPPTKKTLGAGLVHAATHGMHHRAQCIYIMRKLEMNDLPEGDAISWEMQQSC